MRRDRRVRGAESVRFAVGALLFLLVGSAIAGDFGGGTSNVAMLRWAANQTLTGTDTVAYVQNVANKYTLPASGSETLTLAVGTLSPPAGSTNLFTWEFKVCQSSSGLVPLTLAPGSGVTAVHYFNNGSPSGNTLTANQGDVWQCVYDGTYLTCGIAMPNVPCTSAW